MEKKIRKVHLGCADNVWEGWENYDINPVDDRVKYINLMKFPYPFEDVSVDEVMFSHVLEHLPAPHMRYLFEIHRFMKTGGILHLHLPSWGNIITHCGHRFNAGYLNPMLSNKVIWNGKIVSKKPNWKSGTLFYNGFLFECLEYHEKIKTIGHPIEILLGNRPLVTKNLYWKLKRLDAKRVDLDADNSK